MDEKPSLSYIVERGRQLVRRMEPLMALQAEQTDYDLHATTELGDFLFKIRSGGLFYISVNEYVSRCILIAEEEDITVRADELDLLYERILPALECALVMDDLAEI